MTGIISTIPTTWFISNNNKNLCNDMPDNTGTPGNVVCLLMASMPINVLVSLIMFSAPHDVHVQASKYLFLQFFINMRRFFECFKLLSSALYSLIEL